MPLSSISGTLSSVSSKFDSVPKSLKYLGGGLLLFAGLGKLYYDRHRGRRRRAWDSAGIDIVVLHGYPPVEKCPSPSPFALKLETYLRMANIDYIIDSAVWRGGPQNTTPWATVNGRDLSDTNVIMEHMAKKLKIDLSKHLNPEERAVAHAMKVMLEDRFYFCLDLDRFVFNSALEWGEKFYKVGGLLASFFVLPQALSFRQSAEYQGLGNHKQSTVESFGLSDLRCLSAWLGEKPYLTGRMPCEIDCTAFAFLAQIYFVTMETSAYRIAMNDTFPNLKEYVLRMKTKYWPDWERRCADGVAQARKKN